MHGVNFTGATTAGTSFSNSELFGATTANVRASGNFASAEVTASNLSGGDFSNADFSNASLDGARLTGGSFSRADFSNASLRRTDIREADLSGARGLTQDQISEACGDGSTRLPGRLSPRPAAAAQSASFALRPRRQPPRVRNLVSITRPVRLGLIAPGLSLLRPDPALRMGHRAAAQLTLGAVLIE